MDKDVLYMFVWFVSEREREEEEEEEKWAEQEVYYSWRLSGNSGYICTIYVCIVHGRNRERERAMAMTMIITMMMMMMMTVTTT